MVARTWRGATRAEDAERYLEYLHQSGLAAFQETPGNRGATVLRRVAAGRAEFVVVSLWESAEAIRSFAGADIGRAVFFPEDDRYLVERDLHVDHFDVVYAAGALDRAGAA
jgi:heme-degrading monooxygenase HmoA